MDKRNQNAPEAVIRVFKDLETLALKLAEFTLSRILDGPSDRPFSLALAGGTTPAEYYRVLAGEPFRSAMPWNRVHFFWSDERCVPPDHEYSNYRLADRHLLMKIGPPPGNIHRIQGEAGPEQGAEAYNQELEQYFTAFNLPPAFDLILLGLGPDGHTASLFPDFQSTAQTDSRVIGGKAPLHLEPRLDRVSLTMDFINQARTVGFLVAGASKAEVVGALLNAEPESEKYPASLVRPAGKLYWFLDRAAAGKYRPKDENPPEAAQ